MNYGVKATLFRHNLEYFLTMHTLLLLFKDYCREIQPETYGRIAIPQYGSK